MDVDLIMPKSHRVDLLLGRRSRSPVQVTELAEVLLPRHAGREDDEEPSGFLTRVVEAMEAVARNEREVAGSSNDIIVTESEPDRSIEDVKRLGETGVVVR